MGVRELHHFAFGCDGFDPRGEKCPGEGKFNSPDREGAEAHAKHVGWHQDARGWLCPSSHRGPP